MTTADATAAEAVAGERLPGRLIQRLLLREPPVSWVRHLIFAFPDRSGGRGFLREAQRICPVTPAEGGDDVPALQTTLGLTYLGLERLQVPAQVLGWFHRKSPAFVAGAPLRAAIQLGDSGPSAPPFWDAGFQLTQAHALFTFHADDPGVLDQVTRLLCEVAATKDVRLAQQLDGSYIGPRPGEHGQWVHFGYRDGVSQLRLHGWHREDAAGTPPSRRTAWHAPGEFLLGRPNDDGFNPWVLANAQPEVRAFFRDGSFGVLRKMKQDVVGFERWVKESAGLLRDSPQGVALAERAGGCFPDNAAWADYLKAKLCGRWPNGRSFAATGDRPLDLSLPGDGGIEDERAMNLFDYAGDDDGHACPHGAHVRRMNGREPLDGERGVAHVRSRPLIRRGRPYGGPAWDEKAMADGVERGLLGLFFCSSLEDQFEHVLGQWAERAPLGVDDPGRARDPLAGQHADPRARFDIPFEDQPSYRLPEIAAFVQTRGTLYAFHPSLRGLELLLDNDDFRDEEEELIEPPPCQPGDGC